MSLCANDIAKLCLLSANIEQEEDFKTISILLISIMSILKDRVAISRDRIDLSLDHSNFEISMCLNMHIDGSFDNTSNSSTNISIVYSLSENTASNETASLFKILRVGHTWKLMNLGEQVNEHQFIIFFIINMYTCLRVNKSSTQYSIDSSTVEEYYMQQ